MYVDSNLPRHLFGWYSSRLGLEMPIVSYGYGGHPLLLLPPRRPTTSRTSAFT